MDEFKFIKFNYENINIIFSTAEGGLDFNKNSNEGLRNIQKLKEWFHVRNVGYLSQIHSDKVLNYTGEIEEGDALITDKSNVAIGVFTADCVPILFLDKSKKVLAAVHSGWRSTLKNIARKTLENMIEKYSCNPEDILVYIGPHNRNCCFEIGEEVIEQFKHTKEFSEEMLCGRNLNLEKYIITCLKEANILRENIITVDYCTYCDERVKLHSYRKQNKSYGRMFSFIYKE
ncbi:peptidoglycan editing factor PgeF [Hathewaya massiliensis]|uniref:peptidoglycan editing factor PgeF n=1 Tax=Hathewaya massiliensis TaxID=1964382 RepID=UPI001FAA64CB|nr:peptidoglycan editing factor PgeF [Hathewaya massiliensis]